ncbi:unnamed protein product [Didymodactylos carnosus]|uniref:Uncharacterized protein n=1 Tax=Didymodactylos carnosus TaxID=1234261 RepID=A0A816CEW6_9BILA|nr:unnamed protein product [Didymodactylos carnosus]CAF4511432.1 unnamed protein product [Didymodactylos carnosus]
MSSNVSGKCPLCLKPVLVRNFKRHCNSFHTSIDTDQKFQKQICKLKENIIKNNNNENILRQTATNDLPIQRSTSNEFSPPPSKRVRRESANEIENISSIYGTESILNTTNNKEILNCSESDTMKDFGYVTHINKIELSDIKNKICAELQYIIKQTQLTSRFLDLSVNPNISTKHFVIETSTYLTALRESITDLLLKCDQTLEQIPSSLQTTTEMIKSSEISVCRDPSTRKIHNEVEDIENTVFIHTRSDYSECEYDSIKE